MGSFDSGVPEIWDFKVEKYFENFSMLFQAGFIFPRFLMKKHASCTNDWTDFDEPYLIRCEIERPRKRTFFGCILLRGLVIFHEKKRFLNVK